MKSEWETKKIGEVVDIRRGSSPRPIHKFLASEGMPWVKIADATSDTSRYIWKTNEFIIDDGVNKSVKVAPETLIVSNSATPGLPKIMKITACVHDGWLVFSNYRGITRDFLYYKFIDIRRQLVNQANGSVFQNLKTDIVKDFDIDIPSIETQKKIVGILSNIDEKIELNNAINNNLEQQALTLFRQYFIDYAPYGGTVPADWDEVSLDNVCLRITDGSHYSPADAPDSPYPMYSVKDMETYGFNSSSCKHITEDEFHKMQKNDCVPLLNDILIAKDGSYLKEIFICSEEKNEAILSSIAIFRPNTSVIMPEILLYLLKQPSVRKDVGDNYVSGSALPRIVLKDFKKYRFMLPPMDEQVKIGSILHTIRMQTKANIDENQRLSALRDTLLPRLMSGELDVSDIDL